MIGVKRVAYSCAFMIVASASVLTGCGSGQLSSSAPSTAGAVGAPHVLPLPFPWWSASTNGATSCRNWAAPAQASRPCWPAHRSTRMTTSPHRPMPYRSPARNWLSSTVLTTTTGPPSWPRRQRHRFPSSTRPWSPGPPEGANPHLWYSPSAVTMFADAVTAQLGKINPSAAKYFEDRRVAFEAALGPTRT